MSDLIVATLANECTRAVVSVIPQGSHLDYADVPVRRVEVEHRLMNGLVYLVSVNGDVASLSMNHPHLPTTDSPEEGAREEARSSALVGLRNLCGFFDAGDTAAIDAEIGKPMTDMEYWRSAVAMVDGLGTATVHILDVGDDSWGGYGKVGSTWVGMWAQKVPLGLLALTLSPDWYDEWEYVGLA